MTGRDTPSPDSVVPLLDEVGIPEDPALVRAVESVRDLGTGPVPDASAELAQLMADGGRAGRGHRHKRRITFVGGTLAVSMGIGMSGVAAGTLHVPQGIGNAAAPITRFLVRDSTERNPTALIETGSVPAPSNPAPAAAGAPAPAGPPARGPGVAGAVAPVPAGAGGVSGGPAGVVTLGPGPAVARAPAPGPGVAVAPAGASAAVPGRDEPVRTGVVHPGPAPVAAESEPIGARVSAPAIASPAGPRTAATAGDVPGVAPPESRAGTAPAAARGADSARADGREAAGPFRQHVRSKGEPKFRRSTYHSGAVGSEVLPPTSDAAPVPPVPAWAMTPGEPSEEMMQLSSTVPEEHHWLAVLLVRSAMDGGAEPAPAADAALVPLDPAALPEGLLIDDSPVVGRGAGEGAAGAPLVGAATPPVGAAAPPAGTEGPQPARGVSADGTGSVTQGGAAASADEV